MTSLGCKISNTETVNNLAMGKKFKPKSPVGNGVPPLTYFSVHNKQTDGDVIERDDDSGLTFEMEAQFGHGEPKLVPEEPKLSKEDPQETRHLKELLLLHLDWIQQQQETLLAKDRLIARLNQEKDALKCRLERMDRRMALLKQKNEPSPPKPAEVARRDVLSLASASAPPASRNDQPGRGSKRKLSLEPRNLNSKFNEVEDLKPNMVNKSTSTDADLKNSPAVSKPKMLRLSRSHSKKDSPARQQLLLFSQQPPRKCRSQTPASKIKEEPVSSEESSRSRTVVKKDRKAPMEDDSDTDEEVQIMDHQRSRGWAQNARRSLPGHHDLGILRTTDPYYVPVVNDLPPWEISPKKPKPDQVIVPSWKVKHVPTGYQLEGTENLTDEVYIKRHQKPEADEKRRKRWDAQMMREKKMVERLQQRGGNTMTASLGTPDKNNSKKEIEDPLISFIPDPCNVKYVEICDKVPVTAFGYPVPEIVPTEFSLPWFEAAKEELHSRSGRPKKKGSHS